MLKHKMTASQVALRLCKTLAILFYAVAISPWGRRHHSFLSYSIFFKMQTDTKQTCHRHLHSLHPSPDQTQSCVGPQHLSNDSWSQVQHDKRCPTTVPPSYSTWPEGGCYSVSALTTRAFYGVNPNQKSGVIEWN